MKSIYSREVLQRILDRWGIGRIEDVTYFADIGAKTWRHYISTSQGEFELYSYPDSMNEYAEPKLDAYLQSRLRSRVQLLDIHIVHSFDRHHVLLQLGKKYLVSPKQISKDLDLLIGAHIREAFRVYGSIIQIYLDDESENKLGVLVSFGSWRLEQRIADQSSVIVDSQKHSHDELSAAIEQLEGDHPTIISYVLNGDLITINFSNTSSLVFWKADMLAALQIHVTSKDHDIVIFEEKEAYYALSHLELRKKC